MEFDQLVKRISSQEGSTAWARSAERDIVRHDRELWHLRLGLRCVGVLLAGVLFGAAVVLFV